MMRKFKLLLAFVVFATVGFFLTGRAESLLYRFALDGDAANTGTGTSAVTTGGSGTVPWSTTAKFGSGSYGGTASAVAYVLGDGTDGNLGVTSTTGWTFSFWFHPNGMGTWRDLLAFTVGNKTAKFERRDSDALSIYGDSDFEYNSAISYTAGSWNHVAVVSSDDGFDVYINGSLAVSRTTTADISGGLTKIYIGQNGFSDARTSVALIDEVALFDFALSEEQIGLLGNMPADKVLERAPTISINFDGDTGAVDGWYGIEPSMNWVNATGSSGSAVSAAASDASGTASVTYNCANTWYYTDSVDDAALKGYLDDGGDGISITVTDIPFSYYDVIVYQATDNGSYGFNPPSVNGVYYSYDGELESTTRSDSALVYGSSQHPKAVYGTNVVYLKKGFSGDLTIRGAGNANTARGCIAAIQIVKSTAPVVEQKVATSFTTAGAPTEAYGAMVKSDLTAFGAYPKYATEGFGQVVSVTNAAETTYTIFGGAGKSGGDLSTDIWMEIRGGTFEAIFGGSNSDDWGSTRCSINGDVVLEVGGDTVANHVLGGNFKDGMSPTIDGDVSVVVKEYAVVKGLIAGAGISAHSAGATVTGNTKVTVKNIQGDNSAGGFSWAIDSSDYLVGGGVYGKNTGSSETVDGNTEVVIDIAEGTGTFVKNIVGGGFTPSGSNGNGKDNVGGNASVTISAPSTVAFSGEIYAGGLCLASGGEATVGGTATLTLNGGSFTGAKIAGGNATGTKTLAIGGDITIDPSVTTVEGFDVLNVADGKTLTLSSSSAATFALPQTASGLITKAGAGALTLNPSTAGASGAKVTVAAGTLKFVLTTAELAAGGAIALYNTDDELDPAKIVTVTEAGLEVPGDFAKDGTTVKFTPSVSYYEAEIAGDVTWSTKAGLENPTATWKNSPASMLTLTNKTAGAVLDFDVAVTAATVTVSGEMGLTVKGSSLVNVTADVLNFSNCLAGVTIDCADLAKDTLLYTGTIFGTLTAANVPSGYALVQGETSLALRRKADKTRTNPVNDAESATFPAAFFGTTDGDWSKAENWRVPEASGDEELWMPTTHTPARSENAGELWCVLVDGALTPNKTISVDTLEGYNIQYAFLNGVQVTAQTLTKMQGSDGTETWIWVDATSSFTVKALSNNANWGKATTFAVAAERGIVFEPVFNKGANIAYSFTEGGSVSYAGGLGAGTHTLTNGCLEIGGAGLTGGSLTVRGDAAIAFTGETASLGAAVTIKDGKTLTVKGAEGGTTLAVTGTLTGGTVVFDENVTVIDLSTARDTITSTVSFEATAPVVAYTENIVDDGVMPKALTLAAGSATPTYRMRAADGTEKTVMEGTYPISVSGKVAWYDFTFTNTLTSVGTDTTELTRDTNNGLGASTAAYTEEETAIYTAIDAYMAPSYPTVWTASVYAKMPKVPGGILMAFGTNGGGAIALIAGDTNRNEVVLARTTNNTAYVTLATMTVPNAFTASHLYSFCKTEKKISIYLDTTLWSVYTSEDAISFGNGFQLGSLYQGIGNTGFVQYGLSAFTSEAEHSTVGALRLFKAELGPNAIKALADEFPYVSPNGSYSRTLPLADSATWTAEDAWTNVATGETVEAPAQDASVTLTGAGETTVSVNLAADATYEALTLDGAADKVVSLVAAGDAYPGKIRVSGQVTVTAPVKLDYAAIDIAGVPLTITGNGAITFDLKSIDLGAYYADAVIPLTGVASAECQSYLSLVAPTAVAGRSAVLAYDATTQTYGLKITVAGALTAGLPANAATSFSSLAWKMGDVTVTPDWSVVHAARLEPAEGAILDLDTVLASALTLTAADDLSVTRSMADDSNVTLVPAEGKTISAYVAAGTTLETLPCTITGTVGKTGAGTLLIAIDRDYDVKEGLLRAASTATATVTVEAGGTFDFNGKGNNFIELVLNGGSVINEGAEIGRDSRQITGMTVLADSTIGGTNAFGLVSSNYVANTLALGANTLTKEGSNTFFFCATTVTGTGTIDVEEGCLEAVYYSSSFLDGTLTGQGSIRADEGVTFTVGTLSGGLTVEGAGTLKVTNRVDYALMSNVALADGVTIYLPSGTTKAKAFGAKVQEGTVTVAASSDAVLTGAFSFPNSQTVVIDASFEAARRRNGYAKVTDEEHVRYFKPIAISIR